MLAFIRYAASVLGVAAAFALIPTTNGPASVTLALCTLACLGLLWWADDREYARDSATHVLEVLRFFDAQDAEDARRRAEARL